MNSVGIAFSFKSVIKPQLYLMAARFVSVRWRQKTQARSEGIRINRDCGENSRDSMFATSVLLRHLNIRLYFFVQRETHLMRLQAKLNELKQNFLSSGRVSPEMIAIMTRGTDQLRNSGILQRVLKPGDKTPSFELPNQDGKAVSSAALLAKGPLVLSFFRGVW
jgi:hypothetical protein